MHESCLIHVDEMLYFFQHFCKLLTDSIEFLTDQTNFVF